jgi:hypothetical protein
MRTYAIFIGVIVILIGALLLQSNVVQKMKADRDVYKANTETLSNKVDHYKTKDSLNASTVGHLILREGEYSKYRAKDAELINKLNIENRSLQHVTTAQTKMLASIRGQVRDSIIYVPVADTTKPVKADTLKCIKISDKWYNVDGCATKTGEFRGTLITRDSLFIVSTVSYKRFLGFLWRTNKIKDRKIDAVSKNPSTKIEGLEFVEVIK